MSKGFETTFYYLRTWEAISAATFGFILSLVFSYFGQPGRSIVAGAFFGSLAMAIKSSSHLWSAIWYRISVLLLIGLHIAVVILLPWVSAAHWNELIFVPFMAIDLLIVLVIIFFAFRVFCGKPSHLFSYRQPELDYRR
jgi:hypothetical protein